METVSSGTKTVPFMRPTCNVPLPEVMVSWKLTCRLSARWASRGLAIMQGNPTVPVMASE